MSCPTVTTAATRTARSCSISTFPSLCCRLSTCPPPTSCSLGGPEYLDRIATWHNLLVEAHVAPTADGFVATLALAQAAALTDVIVAEQSCCSFLQFTVTFTSTDVCLTVAGHADAQSLIAELSRLAAKESHP